MFWSLQGDLAIPDVGMNPRDEASNLLNHKCGRKEKVDPQKFLNKRFLRLQLGTEEQKSDF